MGDRTIKSAQVSASLGASVQNAMDVGGNVATGVVSLSRNISIISGIGAEQADRAWQWTGIITAGHSKVLWLGRLTGWDIGAGDGKDIVGQAWDAVEIVSILITNNNVIGNYGYLEVTPGDTIPAYWLGSHLVATGGGIGAQGFLFRYEPDLGLPVSVNDHESIRLFANGGDVAVSVAVLGRSTVNESSSSSSSKSSLTSSSSSSSVSSSSSSSKSTSSSSSSRSSVTSSSSSSSRSSATSSSSSNSSSKSSATSSSSSQSSSSSSSS